jgi:predicted transcriptional regulator
MPRTTVELDGRTYEVLSNIAHASGRPVGDVVQLAVAEYLDRAAARHAANGTARRGAELVPRGNLTPTEEADWRRRFEDLLASVRASVPSDMTPDEIEREITLASEEARFERIADRAARVSRLLVRD